MRIFANAFADRSDRRAPQFACDALGYHRHGSLVERIGPREVAAGQQRRAHRLEEPRRDELELPNGRQLGLGVGLVRSVQRIVPAAAVHRDNRRETYRRDAGDRGEFLGDLLFGLNGREPGRDQRFRNRDPHRLHGVGIGEPRVDMAQRLERPDHQARADQEHQCERDLGNDESTTRAPALPALAERTAAGTKCRAQSQTGMPERGDDSKDQSGGQRDRDREQEHRPVKRDLIDARQIGRRHCFQDAQRRIGQSNADEPTHRRQRDAFE